MIAERFDREEMIMELQGIGNDRGSLIDQAEKRQFVIKRDGRHELLGGDKIRVVSGASLSRIRARCFDNDIYQEVSRIIFDGIATIEIEKACILAAVAFIERDPAYGVVATRLLLQKLMHEVQGV